MLSFAKITPALEESSTNQGGGVTKAVSESGFVEGKGNSSTNQAATTEKEGAGSGFVEEGKVFDLIAFDACSIDGKTAKKELAPFTDNIFYSEEEIPGEGFDYSKIKFAAKTNKELIDSIQIGSA
jgi:hypothetical protein